MTKTHEPERLPKIVGADIEVGNFQSGHEGEGDTCREAADALLREIDGLPRVERRHASSCNCRECVARWGPMYGAVSSEPVYDPQDRGRRFVATGHCFYIDLEHLEICLPEVRSARDFVAAKRAALLLARRAQVAANACLPEERHIVVLLNNSDGHGHSYGSHYNFLVTRRCWDQVFGRKLHYLLWLGAYQASAAVLFGAGKVGAENGAPRTPYCLSVRADFIEVLMGPHTMAQRPLCNSRDEPLCGSPYRSRGEVEGARSHVICFDHTLADGSVFLTAGVGQIVHAMLECGRVAPALLLEDPLEAMLRWSQDPTLTATADLLDGTSVTAVELQRLFLREAREFAADGNLDGIVPDGAEILDYTLGMLAARDSAAAARRLDWALKLRIIEEAMRERPELTWESPEIKHLDLIYSSLDEGEGLFWALDGAGETERIVGEDEVARFLHGPPPDTRAWTRGELLRRGGHEVDDVDWDRVRFKTHDRDGNTRYRVVDLPDPAGFSREEMEPIFRDSLSLGEILGRLGATTEPTHGRRDETWSPFHGGRNDANA